MKCYKCKKECLSVTSAVCTNQTQPVMIDFAGKGLCPKCFKAFEKYSNKVFDFFKIRRKTKHKEANK